MEICFSSFQSFVIVLIRPTEVPAIITSPDFNKVSSLYIAQTKKKCGLDVGENFDLPKSENARQPQCTPEKKEAIMQAFKHFGMI